MKPLLLCAFFVAATPLVWCQELVVRGKVCDASTGEALCLVNIAEQGTARGTVSDENGRFSLALAAPGTLVVSLVGYRSEKVVVTSADTSLVVRLFATDILLQEVAVYAGTAEGEKQVEVSSLSVQSREVATITSAIPDVMRSIQMLPGVSANNEFSGKFNVRGGNFDENLVLVNGVQVYEPFHVKEATNVSIGIFNVDLMKSVRFVSGGFSAKYGDRLSSVMDIEYREGSRERVKGAVSMSLTNLDGVVEGPMGDHGSFIIAARKSYFEYVLSLLDLAHDFHPSFYDVQGVAQYSLSPAHSLQIQFIHAGDTYSLNPTTEDYGPWFTSGWWYNGLPATGASAQRDYDREDKSYANSMVDARHTWYLSGSALLQTDLSFYEQTDTEDEEHTSNYRLDVTTSGPRPFYSSLYREVRTNRQRIRTLAASTALDLQLTPFYQVSIGASAQQITYHQNLLNESVLDSYNTFDHPPDTVAVRQIEDAQDSTRANLNARSYKLAGYLENILQWGDHLTLNVGGRLDYFRINRQMTASPRVNAAWRFSDGTTLRVAWGHYYQSPIYDQLASSVSSDTNTQAQKAIHVVGGIERTFPLGTTGTRSLTVKVEGYRKAYSSVISSTRGTYGEISYSRHNDATGLARGIDVYLALTVPRFSAWLSYGLLEATEHLLIDPAGSHPRYTDQRHTLAIVADADLGKQWSLNMRAAYGSGFAYTPYILQYNAGQRKWQWVEGPRNGDYLPAYTRVDARLSRDFLLWGASASVYLDVDNILNLENIQGYRYHYNPSGQPLRDNVTLWPIIPTLGVSVRF